MLICILNRSGSVPFAPLAQLDAECRACGGGGVVSLESLRINEFNIDDYIWTHAGLGDVVIVAETDEGDAEHVAESVRLLAEKLGFPTLSLPSFEHLAERYFPAGG